MAIIAVLRLLAAVSALALTVGLALRWRSRRGATTGADRRGGRASQARDLARAGRDVATIARELHLAQDAVRSALRPPDRRTAPHGRFFRARSHGDNRTTADADAKALWL